MGQREILRRVLLGENDERTVSPMMLVSANKRFIELINKKVGGNKRG